jgi:hypothetical protein
MLVTDFTNVRPAERSRAIKKAVQLLAVVLASAACSPFAGPRPASAGDVEGPVPETQPSATDAFPSAVPASDNPSGPSLRAEGSAEYVARAQAAFALLAACAPEALTTVDQYIDVVLQSERSGMLADEKMFLASDTTAFAPGLPASAQVFWFAGAMVHDARHAYQREMGVTISWDSMTIEERMLIEDDARAVQIEVMRACLPFIDPASADQGLRLLDYLQGMQDGTIPCDYCAVEWSSRDW